MTGLGTLIAFFLALFVTENFWIAALGSLFVWCILASVRALFCLATEHGLLGLVLAALGLSWLFGGGDDDCDA